MVRGELGLATAPPLAVRWSEALNRRRVVVNLSEPRFLDATGAGELAAAHGHAGSRSNRLVARRPALGAVGESRVLLGAALDDGVTPVEAACAPRRRVDPGATTRLAHEGGAVSTPIDVPLPMVEEGVLMALVRSISAIGEARTA
jgi:hypothetical protein